VTPQARPGGRSSRVRTAVLRAAFDVLVEQGYDAMTLPEVARRAGVHPATLYRRWKTKPGLLADAMLDLTDQLGPPPDTGSLRGDLEHLLTGALAVLHQQPARAVLAALAGHPTPTPDVAASRDAFWAARLQPARAVVDRATARGELPAGTDPEALLELLLGPAYLRTLVSGQPTDAAFTRTTVDRAIIALRGR
jgi:AcrR family transcriptional regulator